MGTRASIRMVAGSLALAAAAFCVVAASIRASLDWPDGQGMRTKLTEFETERATVDVVFLGTSRIQAGLDPRAFDARMTELYGRPFRSFNLGLNGSNDFESDRLLRWLIETKSPRLRAVILEAPMFAVEKLPEANRDTYREIAWHDPRQGWRATRFGLVAPGATRERAARAAHHATATLRWLGNHGMGPAGTLFGWPAVEPSFVDYRLADSSVRGFITGRVAQPAFEARRAEYEGDFEQRRRRRRERALTRAQLELVAAQHDVLARAGVTLLHVTAPSLRPVPDYGSLVSAGRVAAVARFDLPSEHPGLFAFSSRGDADHLNDRGAAAWSPQVADTLFERLHASGGGGR